MNVEWYGMNAKYLFKSFKKWSVATHFCVATYFHQRGHEFPNLHSKIPQFGTGSERQALPILLPLTVFWLHLIQKINDSTKHYCYFLSLQATWSTKNKYIITVAFLCPTSHVLGLSILVILLTLNFQPWKKCQPCALQSKLLPFWSVIAFLQHSVQEAPLCSAALEICAGSIWTQPHSQFASV